MTIAPSVVVLLQEVSRQTKGLSEGTLPGAYILMDLYRRLVESYSALAEEEATMFTAKERAYLKRKIEQSKAYQGGRHDDKLSAADSDRAALLAVGDEIDKEIQSAGVYEEIRLLRQSVDRAIEYIRSLLSFMKHAETHA